MITCATSTTDSLRVIELVPATPDQNAPRYSLQICKNQAYLLNGRIALECISSVRDHAEVARNIAAGWNNPVKRWTVRSKHAPLCPILKWDGEHRTNIRALKNRT